MCLIAMILISACMFGHLISERPLCLWIFLFILVIVCLKFEHPIVYGALLFDTMKYELIFLYYFWVEYCNDIYVART
jgi:hypothetical protein